MINPTTLSWTGSSQREDGTAYFPEDRRGFNVFIYPAGESPTEVTFTAISSEGYNFSMPISDLGDPLPDGDWEMVVTDVDAEGRESLYSEAITFSIDSVAIPKPPTGLLAS